MYTLGQQGRADVMKSVIMVSMEINDNIINLIIFFDYFIKKYICYFKVIIFKYKITVSMKIAL